jgi:hypothetical protein
MPVDFISFHFSDTPFPSFGLPVVKSAAVIRQNFPAKREKEFRYFQLNLAHPTIISKQNARCPQFFLKYNVLKFNNLRSGREGKVFEETSPVAYINGQLYIFTTGGSQNKPGPSRFFTPTIQY